MQNLPAYSPATPPPPKTTANGATDRYTLPQKTRKAVFLDELPAYRRVAGFDGVARMPTETSIPALAPNKEGERDQDAPTKKGTRGTRHEGAYWSGCRLWTGAHRHRHDRQPQRPDASRGLAERQGKACLGDAS